MTENARQGQLVKNFDTRAYSISDFAEWDSSGLLVLSPRFQRRAVWSSKAKSYLVDTIVRGKPMPKVIITQALVDGKNVRTVVDGQQRLRTILDYLADGFSVSRTHNSEYGGLTYSQLPEEAKQDFWQYEIGVDLIFETEMSELLDIFSRLNTYSVKLNTTELLNATYLGDFKTAVHTLGHKYADQWKDCGVLSDSQIARMSDVELAGDLLGALLDGVSGRKALKNFYKKYDDDINGRIPAECASFEAVMSYLSELMTPEEWAATNFRRPHLFYSLFLAVSALLNNTPENVEKPEGAVLPSNSKVRVALNDLSLEYDLAGPTDAVSDKRFAEFMKDSRRATTDQLPRMRRSSYIVDTILRATNGNR